MELNSIQIFKKNKSNLLKSNDWDQTQTNLVTHIIVGKPNKTDSAFGVKKGIWNFWRVLPKWISIWKLDLIRAGMHYIKHVLE